jgi:hypothetical protein
MVLGNKSGQAPATMLAKGWIIREEANRFFNDPEFMDFTDFDYPFIFTSADKLNAWMSEVFNASPNEWEMTYNEFEDWRLLEMEPGDKYELYTYVNTGCMWSRHRLGYVVAI